MKTLHQFVSEGKRYEDEQETLTNVKSDDEQRFIEKHTIKKHADRNGNGDKHFKASHIGKDKTKAASYHGDEDADVYEDVEPIDELSKKTMGSYLRKAVRDVDNKSWEAGRQGALNPGSDETKKARHKANQRRNGISRVGRKLAQEETQIDELSKKTLSSYMKKASYDLYNTGRRQENSEKRARDAGGVFKDASRKKHTDQARKHERRAVKRYDGINRASNKLANEEVEQIDELSKKTLGRYIKAAGPDKERKDRDAQELSRLGWAEREAGDHKKKSEYWHRAGGYATKSANRTRGIARAVDKLTREETQIDELSKKTLGNYIKRASINKSDHAYDSGQINQMASDYGVHKGSEADKIRDNANKKHGRRSSGIQRAVDKLTREEVEAFEEMILNNIDEMFFAPVIEVFESLNKNNRAALLERSETPEGLEQIIAFAIDQQ